MRQRVHQHYIPIRTFVFIAFYTAIHAICNCKYCFTHDIKPKSYAFTITEVLLQIVHDLCGVTDDIVIVNQHRNLSGGVQTHKPGLIVFAQRQTHIILLTPKTLLSYCQSHLRQKHNVPLFG